MKTVRESIVRWMEKILPLYHAGRTYAEIGEAVGLKEGTVASYVSQSGLGNSRTQTRTIKRIEREATMRRMYREGTSNADIAAATGYTEASVAVKLSNDGMRYTGPGRRATRNVPFMTEAQRAIYFEMAGRGLSSKERYEIAVKSAR